MGTSGDPMKQLIAIIIAGIVFIFYIASAGVPDWEHYSVGPSTEQAGAFRATVSSPAASYSYALFPDCTVRSSNDPGCNPTCYTFQSTQCNQVRAVQGFLILALLLDAVVIVLMCLVRFGGKEINPIAIHVLLAITAVFTVISFSIFINKLNPPPNPSGSGTGPAFTLGAGIGLMIVSWIMVMADIPLWHIATKSTA